MAILPGYDMKGDSPESQAVFAAPPGIAGINTPDAIKIRRPFYVDNPFRVSSQFRTDRGLGYRPPVGPVEYSEGNIKKSVMLSGPAGYNQRNIPMPDSPDDMSQAEYMTSFANIKPGARQALIEAAMTPKQTFLSTPTSSQEYPSMSHNVKDALLTMARQKMEGKK